MATSPKEKREQVASCGYRKMTRLRIAHRRKCISCPRRPDRGWTSKRHCKLAHVGDLRFRIRMPDVLAIGHLWTIHTRHTFEGLCHDIKTSFARANELHSPRTQRQNLSRVLQRLLRQIKYWARTHKYVIVSVTQHIMY